MIAQQQQQAKLLWVKEGDSSSRLFHEAVRKRQRSNKIHMLLDDRGVMVTDQERITKIIVEYYKDLLGKAPTSIPLNQDVLNLGPKLDPAWHDRLVMEVSEGEIKQALWNIGDMKAPGLDGYNAYFFKRA